MPFRRIALAFLATLLAACHAGETIEPTPLPPLGVSGAFFVVPDTSLLVEGMSRQLGVELANYYYQVGSAAWTSSNPSVATVDRNGRVTAVHEGIATITVAVNGQSASAPVRVQHYPSPLRFTQVSTTLLHTCAVTTTHEAYCWGRGDQGELGNSQPMDTCESLYKGSAGTTRTPYRCSAVPVRVESSAAFTDVAVSWGGACALDANGAGYCWGLVDTVPRVAPTRTTDTLHFTSLSSRCGITTAGDAMCWGPNDAGALGTGSTAPAYAGVNNPALVTGGIKWKALDSGDIAACGLSLDGTAYCWGDNTYGQLGIGSAPSDTGCYLRVCKLAPTAVSTSVRFVQISVGTYSACALTTDGEAYCWGGGGTASVPASLGAFRFATLSVGDFTTCGVTQDQKTLCWGYSNGMGALIPASSPAEVRLPSALRSVAKATLDHGCGVGVDNLLYCWGWPRPVTGLGYLGPAGFNGLSEVYDPLAAAVVGQR